MSVLYIILGLILLLLGGDWLLKAAVGLSLKLNIPKIIIGMTVVSFATSAPELIISIKAALEGATGLAVANVIGSNIANLGLILAITLLLSKIKVEKSFYKTDWLIMMIASIILYFFIVFDKIIQQYEGIILFSLLIIVLIFLLKLKKYPTDQLYKKDDSLSIYKIVLLLSMGGFGLWAGSELLITNSIRLAKNLGISNAIIGVTIISVGTSIPELGASLVAVLKKEKSISLGNLIGSNVFNILGVLGTTAIITPIKIKQDAIRLINNDIYWMLGISFIILPLTLLPKRLYLHWKEGVLLLIAYSIFIYITIK